MRGGQSPAHSHSTCTWKLAKKHYTVQHTVTRLGAAAAVFGVPMWSSSWFGAIPGPETLEEFFRLVQHASGTHRGPILWRGQENYTWRLEPGVVRRLKRSPFMPASAPPILPSLSMARDIEEYEDALLDDAMATGLVARDTLPLHAFATLQHYGAATRLLDFTYNPILALWFACQSSLEIGGVLFALTAERLSGRPSLDQPVADLAKQHGAFCWAPPNSSMRMLAQQSVFLVADIVESPWGCYSGISQTSSPDWVGNDLMPIYVPPSLKSSMSGLWQSALGLSVRSVFPDIEGFSAAHSVSQPLPGWKRRRS